MAKHGITNVGEPVVRDDGLERHRPQRTTRPRWRDRDVTQPRHVGEGGGDRAAPDRVVDDLEAWHRAEDLEVLLLRATWVVVDLDRAKRTELGELLAETNAARSREAEDLEARAGVDLLRKRAELEVPQPERP